MPKPSPTVTKTIPPALNGTPWRINILGGLSAWRGNVEVVRFQTRKSGGLLAYLAYHLNQTHSRDTLVERIWPEHDVARGRACLSTAVYSLRRQLEPPDVPVGSILLANKVEVRLNPRSVTTDLQEFASKIHQSKSESIPSRHLDLL